ncbi:MAG: hypothetical protein DWQ09_16170 [Proteobacteria bacterium]|nr:MAG: hypothetical protein DWQ09_16170 [Pseudomonadota bacterium]
MGCSARRAKRWRGAVLGVGVLAVLDAHALALGEMEVRSFLNERFVATIGLAVAPDERVVSECITLTLPPGQDGRDAGISYLRDAEIEVLKEGEATTLTIRSRKRVVDPVLGMVLRVDCEGSGTLLREYTALLDPRLPRSLQPAYARSAPAARPAVVPEVSAAPAQGTWHVRPGQTLSRIAASLAPGNRREQTRLIAAIVTANPGVFPDGDPDRLPAGALLKIPDGTKTTFGMASQPAPMVATSARTPSAAPVPEPDTKPRLTLTNSEQVTDLKSANETARMVAESRRLLMETEAQYVDTEALKARLQRLEKQIALLERALVLTERNAAITQPAPASERSGAVANSDSVQPDAAVAMVVPPAAIPEQKPAVQIATPVVPASSASGDSPRRNYWWWLGGGLLFGVLLLLWRSRPRAEADQEEALVEWQLDQLVPAPVGAAPGAGTLGGEVPDLAHKETAFQLDPLANLPEQDESPESAASAEEVPTLDHELTAQMEQRDLVIETFDFEERDAAAKPEVGNVLVRAEFYLLLRQPENAIKLLRETIEGDEPLAREPALWLMLLRIYRQERMRESFDHLRAEFAKLFNIAVPEWGEITKPAADAALEHDFPRILNRIVKLWDSQFCEDFLNGLLRDDREGSRHGFDLNVAEELLLLKGVWRIRRTM